MSKKIRYWLAQILGWGAYYSLITFAAYSVRPELFTINYFWELLVDFLISIFFTHMVRLIFIRFEWVNWRFSKLILPIIGVSILTGASIYGGQVLFNHFYSSFDSGEQVLLWQHFFGMGWYAVICMFWNTIYFIYHISQRSIKQEVSNLKLKANNKEIQLKNLQSQLNPHFLFNSLNGIRALVDLDPELSKKSITRLSSLLRISLQFGKQNLVSIEEEIQLVQHYLELEKMRFEDRLHFSFDLDDELSTKKIPPFTIQLLAENAIKHGVSRRKEGGEIRINSYSEGEWTVLEVKNSGKLQDKVDLGVGLMNIRKRLLLQYGRANAQFNLDQVENEEAVLAIIKVKA